MCTLGVGRGGDLFTLEMGAPAAVVLLCVALFFVGDARLTDVSKRNDALSVVRRF